MTNALTVDVEEYYHAIIFREATEGHTDGLESRVEASIERVLALLAFHDAKATFFVLGQVASDHPAMIRKIAGEGHEIACHGYHHQLVSRQTPQEFRADIHHLPPASFVTAPRPAPRRHRGPGGHCRTRCQPP